MPIAVIETKDNNYSVGAGMQQWLEYAKMADVPFALRSPANGFALLDRVQVIAAHLDHHSRCVDIAERWLYHTSAEILAALIARFGDVVVGLHARMELELAPPMQETAEAPRLAQGPSLRWPTPAARIVGHAPTCCKGDPP